MHSPDILNKDYLWKEELLKVNETFLFSCASMANRNHLDRNETGLFTQHAYSIIKAVEVKGKRLCLVRNPWGKSEWKGPWSAYLHS